MLNGTIKADLSSASREPMALLSAYHAKGKLVFIFLTNKQLSNTKNVIGYDTALNLFS